MKSFWASLSSQGLDMEKLRVEGLSAPPVRTETSYSQLSRIIGAASVPESGRPESFSFNPPQPCRNMLSH